jgi:preprotein translocase subunit YajC
MSALLILLIPLALYLLIIRPQRQRVLAQQRASRVAGPGDRVVTAGGIIGTIVDSSEVRVHVEIAPGLTIELLPQAIVRVVTDEPAADGEPSVDSAPPLQIPDDLSELDTTSPPDPPAADSAPIPTPAEDDPSGPEEN